MWAKYRAIRVLGLGAVVFLQCSGIAVFAQCEELKLTASDPGGEDYFGGSISVGADYMVVGARDNDDADPDDVRCDSGSAYVFAYDGVTWIEEVKLTASDARCGGFFGNAMSISGNCAVVGAYSAGPGEDPGGGVYVFRDNGTTWVEETTLTAADAGESFGGSVSVSGDCILAGAPRDDDLGDRSGSAYVFRWNGSTWTQEAKLLAADGAPADWFGRAVAVDGDVGVVGALHSDPNGSSSGGAYVFRHTSGTWVQEAKLVASDGQEWDLFGHRVAVDGDTVVIGAPGADDACPGDISCNSGAAYVYRYDGAIWAEEGKLLPSDGARGDDFGYSVAVQGPYALVGARRKDGVWMSDGAAYLFTRVEGNWVQVAKLRAWDVGQSGVGFRLGGAVALGGEHAVVGAVRGWDTVVESGSVYTYGIFGGSDCNDNGVTDACEGVEDCNQNGTVDQCDIADGTSMDCDDNRVPDECESPEDCNGNGLQDFCDISSGTSLDCNDNGVPDDCEPPGDCNDNGIQDICDIFQGTIDDCNGNSVSDECDITSGDSQDCNANGIPDECEADCQDNCIADDCDIASGASTDEDGDGVPDECEIPGDLSINPRVPLETRSVTVGISHQFGDVCYELCGATGTWIDSSHYHIDWYVRDLHQPGVWCLQVLITLSSQFSLGVLEPGEYTVSATEHMTTWWDGDCSPRDVFGEAEATLRVAPDCNANGVADSCDIIEGQSVDTNGNGIPDECEPDCDGNGILDDTECVLVDGPQAIPGGAGNNRYLSFLPDPGGSGCRTALRVIFESLPAPWDVYNGMSLWVGRPQELTENSGNRLPSEAPGWPTFWGASLRCQPVFEDWSAMGTLQIYDEGLVPGGIYTIQAIEEGCDTPFEEMYSPPLGLSMGRWGDVCAPGPGGACSGPPDGIVDVANDVLGVLEKFANGGGAPSKPQADLEPAMPDQIINITDVMHALGAFGGQEYDFPVPAPCP